MQFHTPADLSAEYLATGIFGLKAATYMAALDTGFLASTIEESYPLEHEARKIPYLLGWPIKLATFEANSRSGVKTGINVRVPCHFGDEVGIIHEIDETGYSIRFSESMKISTYGKEDIELA